MSSERDDAARRPREARRIEAGPAPAEAVRLPDPGGPIGRVDALRLQRASGNAAVGALLQRQARTQTHASPTNLRMDPTGSPVPSDPTGLQVVMRWDSSTGNLADLAGAGFLRERVTRVGAVPIPPFVAGLSIVQPLVEHTLPASQLTRGWAYDSHFGFGPQLDHTHAGTLTSNQEYQWSATENGPWQTLATFTITRSVYHRNATGWHYRVAKTGAGEPLWIDTPFAS
jgi:hypothetical protein